VCFGYWESDTVVGKGHNGAIASQKRKSKYTVMALPRYRRAASFNAALDRHRRWFDVPLLTMTTYSGKDFAEHEELAKRLGVNIYFAHPKNSWERGGNENLNRMIQQWVPKATDFCMLIRAMFKPSNGCSTTDQENHSDTEHQQKSYYA